MSGHYKRKSGPPFVQIHKWLTGSAAWKDLSPTARCAYFEIKQRYNGFNNGSIGLGVRELADALGVSRSVAGRALLEVRQHGFASVAKPSSFGTNGRRATEWLLTEERDDRTGHSATKEFMRWTPSQRPPIDRHRKKTSVPPAGRMVPPAGRKASKAPSSERKRPPSGTFLPQSVQEASPQRATSRSSHDHGRRIAATGADT